MLTAVQLSVEYLVAGRIVGWGGFDMAVVVVKEI